MTAAPDRAGLAAARYSLLWRTSCMRARSVVAKALLRTAATGQAANWLSRMAPCTNR